MLNSSADINNLGRIVTRLNMGGLNLKALRYRTGPKSRVAIPKQKSKSLYSKILRFKLKRNSKC
jgi:hypothetical protein